LPFLLSFFSNPGRLIYRIHQIPRHHNATRVTNCTGSKNILRPQLCGTAKSSTESAGRSRGTWSKHRHSLCSNHLDISVLGPQKTLRFILPQKQQRGRQDDESKHQNHDNAKRKQRKKTCKLHEFPPRWPSAPCVIRKRIIDEWCSRNNHAMTMPWSFLPIPTVRFDGNAMEIGVLIWLGVFLWKLGQFAKMVRHHTPPILWSRASFPLHFTRGIIAKFFNNLLLTQSKQSHLHSPRKKRARFVVDAQAGSATCKSRLVPFFPTPRSAGCRFLFWFSISTMDVTRWSWSEL